MKILRILASVVALSTFASAAHATNLVQNPNFMGTSYTYPGYVDVDQQRNAAPGLNPLPSWTATFSAGWNPGPNQGPFWDNGTAPNGVNSVGFAQFDSSLSQELTGLTVGQLYNFSFYDNARNCCGGTPTLTASIGGMSLYSAALSSGSFNLVSTTFTATQTSELLLFQNSTTNNADGSSLFTDVNVSAATAVTPEPSSFILLGTGVLSAVGMARRKFLKA